MVTNSPTNAGIGNLTQKKPPRSPTEAGFSNLTGGSNQEGFIGGGSSSNPTAPTRENAANLNPTAPTRENASRRSENRISAERRRLIDARARISYLTQQRNAQFAASGYQLPENGPTATGVDVLTSPNASSVATPPQGGGAVAPSGFGNVIDVYRAALNPFDDTSVVSNTGNERLDAVLEYVANNPFETALYGTTGYYAIRGAIAGMSALAQGQTATATAIQQGVPATAPTSTAAAVPVNTKNAAATVSWLSKFYTAAKNPRLAAGAAASLLVAAIGSYPFAGFIKEEALQTLSMGANSAMNSGDIAGAREALDMQKEILNPDVTNRIMNLVPIANIVNNLGDFFGAANVKLAIDETRWEDMVAQEVTGMTEDQIWEERRVQRLEDEERERLAQLENYAIMLRMKEDAQRSNRAEEAAYWDEQLKKREEYEARQRELNEAYWQEYFKRRQQERDDAAPSKLNFGFI